MEWHVDKIATHDWDNNNQEPVQVHWNLDSTIKATELLQSAKPDHPADYLHHTDMRVVTHNAHQCNRCDPWLAPFAHTLDFGDAISTEAEQQRDATIIGRLSAECADSCQALRAAHAMDNFQHTYDALCYQPGHMDNNNECDKSLRDHSHHTLRQCKFTCRHGSSPSPSRGLSRSASSPQEDPVVGLLPPTHPFISHPATNPWSSMLPSAAPVDASGNMPLNAPGDTPPASSLTIDDPGDTPVKDVSNMPANAHGDAPVPPTLAAFAP
ncbi:hypothetical protein BC826DRAFT_1109068 [Russula brevipes]|nr:hypothetical protein BC826DRAFT_1109068 [Russula brevipes]